MAMEPEEYSYWFEALLELRRIEAEAMKKALEEGADND